MPTHTEIIEEFNNKMPKLFTDRNGLTLCRQSIWSICFYDFHNVLSGMHFLNEKDTDQDLEILLQVNEKIGRSWEFRSVPRVTKAVPSPLDNQDVSDG